jgi:hypothetical protein
MNQLKSFFSFPKKTQIPPFSNLCLTYFCKKESVPSDDMKVNDLLHNFHHTKLNSKEILKTFQCEKPPSDEITFHFDSFPLPYYLDVSEKLSISFQFSERFNKTLFYSWIFRGILVVSYYFENELKSYMHDKQMQHFPPSFWSKIQFSLAFLLSTAKEGQKIDLIIALQPFFEVESTKIFKILDKTDLHKFLHCFFLLTIPHYQYICKQSFSHPFFD